VSFEIAGSNLLICVKKQLDKIYKHLKYEIVYDNFSKEKYFDSSTLTKKKKKKKN